MILDSIIRLFHGAQNCGHIYRSVFYFLHLFTVRLHFDGNDEPFIIANLIFSITIFAVEEME